jgi:signal peptide peptidase SppA
MSSRLLHAQAFGRPVAILPAKLDAITGLLYRHHHYPQLDRLAVEIAVEKDTPPATTLLDAYSGEPLIAESPKPGQAARYIAVLPLYGVLIQHAGVMTEYSGGTSLQTWSEEFRRLDADPSIGWIVIDTHSPGGSVYFVEETSDLIYAARQRGQTKIIQVANSMAASAAVWIGTAASEVVVTPGGEYGSIGVISQYVDASKWNEANGYQVTYVRTPEGKARFTGDEPLTEEMLATLTTRNEQAYERFVRAVARNRATSPAKVKSDFGQGEMLSPGEAKAAGLIDRIGTLQDVIDGLVSAKRKAAAGVRWAAAGNRLKLAEA